MGKRLAAALGGSPVAVSVPQPPLLPPPLQLRLPPVRDPIGPCLTLTLLSDAASKRQEVRR